MSEDNDDSVKKVTQSATGLAVDLIKSVPLDESTKNTAGGEIGKTIVTLTKAINVALSPVSLTIFGYEKIKGFIETTLKEKLSKIPEENIIHPKGNVVGPALENLKYLDENEEDLSIKNMYANLIANAINKETKDSIHPAFVDIIKQLENNDVMILEAMRVQNAIAFIRIKKKRPSDEGSGELIVMKYVFNNEIVQSVEFNPNSLYSSIENLERLKLITVSDDRFFTDDTLYEKIRNEPTYLSLKTKLQEYFHESLGMVEISTLGQRFLSVCTD
ncbi:TPA: DUF4393 domain-containing protein [Morganella morganii]|uniref:DUF4393 domain-containing protein n=1 Tax=Morganella morganii TaxID=582 RepID=A0AAN5RYN7_MORMO|nr:DUF4393 domain-containing protein [Morganella morganii]HDF2343836.1 DUF4393 domain-containing protein [Morganella morganii]